MDQRRLTMPRRTFLVGAAATGVLAACGGSGEDDSYADGDDGATGDAPPAGDDAGGDIDTDGTYSLIQRVPPDVAVPGVVRMPIGLFADAEFVNDGPDVLRAQLVDADGRAIGDRTVAPRRDVTPSAYYDFRLDIAEAGIYALIVEGGPSTGLSFQVFEPSQVAIPVVGDELGGFDTPTFDDPKGLEPICTRDPICEFHSVTLTDALGEGKHVAYFVGTPQFCQTGSCTPALEAMITVAPDFADDFVFVHAEVFTDDTATTVAPAVEALGLTFEPTIFLTDARGVIVERLDGLWDESELRERLRAALA